MSFTQYYKENFYQKLLTPNGNNPVRNRADGFLKMFEELEAKGSDYCRILETGCMRADHGELSFGDDGCSTYLFDQFVSYYDGIVYSVDISEDNCNHAKKMVSKKTIITCWDSVKYLYGIPDELKFDLVYLDSFDLVRNEEHLSQLHHLKELCAVLKNTESGTIVAVDDNKVFGQQGKGNYVTDFMQNIGAEILHDGYQIVFKL